MIATSVRASLTADDMRLAVELLGGSESERVRLSQKAMDEGPDALWDDPRLMGALVASRDISRPSARLFFYAVLSVGRGSNRAAPPPPGGDDRMIHVERES